MKYSIQLQDFSLFDVGVEFWMKQIHNFLMPGPESEIFFWTVK